MRKLNLVVLALTFGLCFFGKSILVLAADPASESFIKKMQPYAGRVLNGDEIQRVLKGNTLFRVRGNRRGRFYETWWSYRDAKNMHSSNSTTNVEGYSSTWSASQNGRYCHYAKFGNVDFCRRNVRLSIEDGKVLVKMGSRRILTYTLLEGRHEN